MADYSERDATMIDQARFVRVQQWLDTLLDDRLSMADVKDLLQRVVCFMEYLRRQ